MRTRPRLLGFATAVMLAALGVLGPAAQAAAPGDVDRQKCEYTGGKVEYDSSTGLWTCIGGEHDQEAVT
ncbi:hypothetical protein ACFTWH_14550 [Streptomyces sp. NPDC057011]|uniref:hypothetical protein n=1 Tax=unclassified Streptomyces TaxID=2593676 RepID=UPI003634811F